MSISKLLPLFVVLGLATVANAKTPKPNKLPVAPAAATAKTRAVAIASEFEIITGFDPAKVVKTIDITKGQTDLHGQICPRKTIPIVANPTSDASDARQKFLNGVRRDNAMPDECETNDAGLCRSGLLQAGVNNSNGKIFCVLPDGFTTPADMKKLGDKVEQLAKDTDKDGIKDIDDKCVEVPAGPTPDPSKVGCPDQDTDKDGLLDHYGDACPTEAGPRENHGCPMKDAPAAVATPAPATTDAPKAAAPKPVNNGAKKNSLYIPVGLYTGSLLSGSSLRNAHGGVDVGVSLQMLLTLEQLKGWSLALTLDLGQNTSFLNRGTVASNFPFMASFGGLYNLSQRVQIGPEAWFGIVRTNLPDQDSYFAHVCGGLGPRVQTSVGAVQFFVAAGIGGCRSAQPGYTPGANGQPSAEVGGQVHGGLQIRIPAKRW